MHCENKITIIPTAIKVSLRQTNSTLRHNRRNHNSYSKNSEVYLAKVSMTSKSISEVTATSDMKPSYQQDGSNSRQLGRIMICKVLMYEQFAFTPMPKT